MHMDEPARTSFQKDYYVELLPSESPAMQQESKLKKLILSNTNRLMMLSSVFCFSILLFVLIRKSSTSYPNYVESKKLPNYKEDKAKPLLNSEKDFTLEEYQQDPLSLISHALDFEEFVKKHDKTYDSLEIKIHRFKIYMDNKLKIHKHNTSKPPPSYTMSVNQFADLTSEEFKIYLGYKNTYDLLESDRASNEVFTYQDDPNSVLPDEINWEEKGCVTKAKNQGKCGSCWAFSASGAIEGAYCVKHKKLLNLSEQQLIDCADKEGNYGCKGGIMDHAFLYMIKEKGLCTEQDYPYKGSSGQCRAQFCASQVKVLRYVDVHHKDEKALRAAIALNGPVSVGVQSDAWQFYHSGIYDAPCGNNLNHAVLVIGYGTLNSTDYWLIKNSWGQFWGDDGFMKLARKSRKKYGECGILVEPSFPIVE